MVLIVEPFTLIRNTLSLEVDSFAIKLVLAPVSYICVALGVDDPAKALASIIDEVTIKARPIRPRLNTSTMT